MEGERPKRGFPLTSVMEPFLGDFDQLQARLYLYRDIFNEITAKAIPQTDPTSDDPERVRHYVLPVGPIHRAAGRLGFQMFDGEKHLADAMTRIRELEARLASFNT